MGYMSGGFAMAIAISAFYSAGVSSLFFSKGLGWHWKPAAWLMAVVVLPPLACMVLGTAGE